MIFGDTSLAKRALHDLPYGHLRDHCMRAHPWWNPYRLSAYQALWSQKSGVIQGRPTAGKRKNVNDNAISPNISPWFLIYVALPRCSIQMRIQIQMHPTCGIDNAPDPLASGIQKAFTVSLCLSTFQVSTSITLQWHFSLALSFFLDDCISCILKFLLRRIKGCFYSFGGIVKSLRKKNIWK